MLERVLAPSTLSLHATWLSMSSHTRRTYSTVSMVVPGKSVDATSCIGRSSVTTYATSGPLPTSPAPHTVDTLLVPALSAPDTVPLTGSGLTGVPGPQAS